MNRKKFIRSAGLSLTALIIGDPFSLRNEQKNRIQMPDHVRALMNGRSITLTKDGANHWQSGNLYIELIEKNDNVQVQIAAPGISLESITLEWEIPINANSLLL